METNKRKEIDRPSDYLVKQIIGSLEGFNKNVDISGLQFAYSITAHSSINIFRRLLKDIYEILYSTVARNIKQVGKDGFNNFIKTFGNTVGTLRNLVVKIYRPDPVEVCYLTIFMTNEDDEVITKLEHAIVCDLSIFNTKTYDEIFTSLEPFSITGGENDA